MFHPIVSTVLGHPELVAEHLANYGALIREESQAASQGLISKLMAGVIAAVSGMLRLKLRQIQPLDGLVQEKSEMLRPQFVLDARR